MKKLSSLTILIIIIIIIVSVFAILFRFQLPSSKRTMTPPATTTPITSPTSPKPNPEYPAFLIEGKLTKIEKKDSGAELTVEVNIDKIFLEPPVKTKSIVVSVNKDTKISLYDLVTKEETPANIESLQINDQVVIGTVESNWDIMKRDSYTAKTISKMLLPPPPPK